VIAVAKPNEPRIGVLAARLVEVMATADYETLYTFDALRRLLFEDPQGMRGNAAIQRAKRVLHEQYERALVNVRNVGYQIAHPNEHQHYQARHYRSSRRRLRVAIRFGTHVKRELLTPAQQQALDESTNRLAILVAVGESVRRAKALPPAADIHVPSGRELAELLNAKQ